MSRRIEKYLCWLELGEVGSFLIVMGTFLGTTGGGRSATGTCLFSFSDGHQPGSPPTPCPTATINFQGLRHHRLSPFSLYSHFLPLFYRFWKFYCPFLFPIGLVLHCRIYVPFHKERPHLWSVGCPTRCCSDMRANM